ncbi:MAG: chemoreceptor glutamine deamidase CheD [Myxococcota bacterium]
MSPPAPRVMNGFEHIKPFWDSTAGTWVSVIQPGQFYVSRSDQVIATTLGSCIAVCARDRMGTIGGMNHFMLPGLGPSGGRVSDSGSVSRYGFFAIEQLLNGVLSMGVSRSSLEIKIFGGGRIIESDVGDKNAEFAKRYFRVEGIDVAAVDVGKNYGRRVRYHPLTGKAWVRKVEAYEVADQEVKITKTPIAVPKAGDVELFS